MKGCEQDVHGIDLLLNVFQAREQKSEKQQTKQNQRKPTRLISMSKHTYNQEYFFFLFRNCLLLQIQT